MPGNRIDKPLTGIEISAQPTSQSESLLLRPIIGCVLAFLVCTLISIAPIQRLAGTTVLSSLPTNGLLALAGSWLPDRLPLSRDLHAAIISTNNLEFLLFIFLAFAIYALCAFFISRLQIQTIKRRILYLIWAGAILAGLLYVFTPAMLSHDIFVYVGYGRIIAFHSANPYFVPLTAFPHDPYIKLDDWNYATSAYGPLWLYFCALSAVLFGDHQILLVIGFRLLALACHLCNIWLVYAILRSTGKSPRTVLLATQLYAWNPLVLFESCLGGHNDIFMLTLILIGVLLSIRGEHTNLLRPRSFVPPLLLFTLAALIKFSALPVVMLFIIMLVFKGLGVEPQLSRFSRWRRALLVGLSATIFASLLALAFYAPFWIGHSYREIIDSFSLPPSSRYAENSILRAIQDWIILNGLPDQHTWQYRLLYPLSLHRIWDRINIATLITTLGIGMYWLWRHPTTRTMVIATLTTLGALLVVTSWFYPWYLIWLIGLVVVILPVIQERIGRALLAFTLTFSATALVTYLFNSYPPFGSWVGYACLTTICPPIIAFLFYLTRKVGTTAFSTSTSSSSDNRTFGEPTTWREAR